MIRPISGCGCNDPYEYHISVSPDCAQTANESHCRTWFYFRVRAITTANDGANLDANYGTGSRNSVTTCPPANKLNFNSMHSSPSTQNGPGERHIHPIHVVLRGMQNQSKLYKENYVPFMRQPGETWKRIPSYMFSSPKATADRMREDNAYNPYDDPLNVYHLPPGLPTPTTAQLTLASTSCKHFYEDPNELSSIYPSKYGSGLNVAFVAPIPFYHHKREDTYVEFAFCVPYRYCDLETYLIRLKLQFQPSYEAVLDEVIAKKEARKQAISGETGEISDDEEQVLKEGEVLAVDSTGDDEFGLHGLKREAEKWRQEVQGIKASSTIGGNDDSANDDEQANGGDNSDSEGGSDTEASKSRKQ